MWVLRRTRLAGDTVALAIAFVGSAVLFAIPPFAFFGGFGGSGIPVGAGLLAIVQVFALPILAAPLLAPR